MQPFENITGPIPAGATHFKVMQRAAKEGGGEKWVPCFGMSTEGDDVKVAMWAIDVLDLDLIRAGWGPAFYQLIFFGTRGDGPDQKHIRIKPSRIFELTEQRSANVGARGMASAAPPPAPVPTPVSEGMTMIQMASMLAKDQIAMIQLLSQQANQQQQAMAAQQIAFLQETSRSTTHQMSQHYAAMLRASKTNDAPILAAVQELGQRVRELEDYESEPEPAPASPAPLGGIVTPEGGISPPHIAAKLLEHVPDALQLGRDFLNDRAASRLAGERGGSSS